VAIGAFMPGFAGFLGSNLLLVAAAICSFLGLAVLHSLVRGWTHRAFLLVPIYMLIFFLFWPVLLLAVLGMAEPWLKLRDRIAARPSS
jgi:hypothetical protein